MASGFLFFISSLIRRGNNWRFTLQYIQQECPHITQGSMKVAASISNSMMNESLIYIGMRAKIISTTDKFKILKHILYTGIITDGVHNQNNQS